MPKIAEAQPAKEAETAQLPEVPEAAAAGKDAEQEKLNAKLRSVFDEKMSAGAAEDDVKLAMISNGATFKNVTRLFNEFMVAGGHTASKEEREQTLLSAVEGCDLTNEEGYNSAVAKLVASAKGVTERAAGALVRAHAKKAGVEVFKKAKESSGEGRTGFSSLFYDFLAQNTGCTKEQATAFINGTDGNAATSENTKRHLTHYIAIWGLVNRIAQTLPRAA
jgi:hypothetical protein